jgi:hypothetical protein
LSVEKHVAYYPHRSGTVMTLEDPYELPWTAQAFAMAHQAQNRPFADFFTRRRLRHRMIPKPALKQALMQPRQGASW